MINQNTPFQDSINYFKHVIRSFEANMAFSILGTTKNLKFDEFKRNAFKIGLTKAFQYFFRYNILVFTEGSEKDVGIARLVGDVLFDDFHAAKHIKLIGIPNLENIIYREDKAKIVRFEKLSSFLSIQKYFIKIILD